MSGSRRIGPNGKSANGFRVWPWPRECKWCCRHSCGLSIIPRRNWRRIMNYNYEPWNGIAKGRSFADPWNPSSRPPRSRWPARDTVPVIITLFVWITLTRWKVSDFFNDGLAENQESMTNILLPPLRGQTKTNCLPAVQLAHTFFRTLHNNKIIPLKSVFVT